MSYREMVSMGCYLKRPQLQVFNLLEATGDGRFQWAATSNALSYPPRFKFLNRRGFCHRFRASLIFCQQARES